MSTRPAKRVLLIGWDAADWQIITPLLEAGQMPVLQEFIDNGVMGKLATLRPVISPILWNSIATGKLADKHGILGFVEPDGRGGVRPVSSTSRQCKAIWNILSQRGLRSCVVGWYASHPAEPINGTVVTERYHHTSGRRSERFPLDAQAIHPPELLETLKDFRVTLNDITAEQVLPFIPQAARIKQPDDARLPALCHLLAECATTHNAATYLMEHEAWDLMAVYYATIDHFGHAFMEYHPPKMDHISEEEFEIYQHVMTGCYRYHDMMLGRLLQLAGPDTTVMIVSDHGYYNDDLRPKIFRDPKDPRRKTGPGVNPVAWHRRYGVLAMRGPGIKKDELVHGASLIDIAPTVLAMLGLPIAKDMDGEPLTQVFCEPVTVEQIETYEGEHERDGMHRGEQEDDPGSAREVLKRLAELGYIEAPGDDDEKIAERAQLDRKHNLAQVYFSTGRVKEAYDLLLELLAAGENPHLRCRIAMCLITMRRFAEAEAMLKTVIAEPFEHTLADMLYGQLLIERGEYDEAQKLLLQAQGADPRLAHLHTHLGSIHMRQGDWEPAEKAFRRALEIDGDDPEAHDWLGQALFKQGNVEDALFHHMSSVALEHHRPETHINLGLAAAQLRKTDWAIRAFNVAAEQAPKSPLPHRLLARIYRRQKKDRETALRHARLARKLGQQLHAQPSE